MFYSVSSFTCGMEFGLFFLYILVGSRESLYEWLLSRYHHKLEIPEFCFQIDSWVPPKRIVNSESSRSYLQSKCGNITRWQSMRNLESQELKCGTMGPRYEWKNYKHAPYWETGQLLTWYHSTKSSWKVSANYGPVYLTFLMERINN